MSYDDRAHFLGLDLGKVSDFAALARLSRHTVNNVATYAGTYLHRWKIGTPYTDVIKDMIKVLQSESLQKGKVTLVVDATGVGLPVVDMLKEAKRAARLSTTIRPVIITGGHKAHREDDVDYVPKRLLVSTVQALLQTGRFKFAKELPEATTLAGELQNFQLTVTEAMHDTYEGRKGTHDDLVLAVALALWCGMRASGRLVTW